MDPLVELLHRGRLLHESDHSLDALPVTAFLVAFLLLISTTLALRWTGRSWRAWYGPALLVLFVWWAGVNMGHSGLVSGPGLMWAVIMVLLLIGPSWRALRAALLPAKRD